MEDASAGWQTQGSERWQGTPCETAGSDTPRLQHARRTCLRRHTWPASASGMIAGEGRQWQRAAGPRGWKIRKERKRQQGVFKHFAIVKHFLFYTKSVPIGMGTAESFIKPMGDIGNLNWISFLRCSIMNLSPLFSSKDRFSPLPQRAFFCPARRRGHRRDISAAHLCCTAKSTPTHVVVFRPLPASRLLVFLVRKRIQSCRPRLPIWCTMHPLFV